MAGNLIGTDVTGSTAIPNTYGVAIDSSNNLVGTSGQDGADDAVERNVISGNSKQGIYLYGAGATGNVIAGNYIGLTASGSAALGDGNYGVYASGGASDNWIGVNSVHGAENADERNVISGNAYDGIEITGTGTTGNVVAGDYIGTDATGTIALANGTVYVYSGDDDINGGVLIAGGASGNLIGTSGQDGSYDADERNVISGNGYTGVIISGARTSNNVVAGNYIGTTSSGESALGDGVYGDGVDIANGASGNWIGVNPAAGSGTENADQGNLISGLNPSNGWGVWIDPTSSGNVIAGNLIGTDATGTQSLADAVGVYIQGPSNLVGATGQDGGADVLERNVISGNSGNGVDITGSTAAGNVIAGNYIGTNAAGTVALANSGDGVEVSSGANANWIGVNSVYGPESADQRNVISGNSGGRSDGVFVTGTGTNGNVIAGNYIGLNAAGNAAIANGDSGVRVDSGAANTQIGTNPNNPNPLERNVISGNVNDNGVWIREAGAGTVVAGNYIGTDSTGTFGIGNGPTPQADGDGVVVEGNLSAGVTIGGTVAGAGNVISDNYVGVLITDSNIGTSDVLVEGNLIGTNAAGNAALPNTQFGIQIGDASPSDPETGNTIGGTAAAAMNLISGNAGAGVELDGASTYGNLVEGNFIGTNLAGNAALPNSGPGVLIVAGPGNGIGTGAPTNNTIGGDVVGAGNLISGNTGDGVEISGTGTTGNVVAGNLVGLNQSGTQALANGGYGIAVAGGATSNTIGGTAAGAANVASGNNQSGIVVRDSGTSLNVVVGNFAGTNEAGTAAVANQNAGILIQGGAQNNTIGGPAAADRNLVSGNVLGGIAFYLAGASGNLAEGNWVGLNAAGTGTIANLAGITFSDGASGDTAIDNVVSGNTLAGIFIGAYETSTGTFGNLVQGNLIGTDPTGSLALGNVGPGVLIFAASTGNTIGGTAAGAGNLISGGMSAGVSISGTGTSGNIVLGNSIGTNLGGSAALANSGDGVVITGGASNNTVGGTTAGAGNVIAFNTGVGVQVGASPTDASTGDAILENSIFANTTLGIGLGGSSVVLNDSEGHTGPNLFQDFPVISSVVTAGGTTTIDGMITEAANTTYRIEFFGDYVADPSGYGQGQVFLTYANVTTDASGATSFSVTIPGSLSGAGSVSATATDPAGNTSEFSADAIVTAAGGSYIVTNTADSGSGSLRAAIEAADASTGSFTIDFDIPASDPGYDPSTNFWTIAVASALPAVTESVTIDGYSQPGWTPIGGGPVILLNGSNAGPGSDGLDLEANDVFVFALLINGFSGDGVSVASDDNALEDVNVGVAANYGSAVPDGVGIYITGADNLIGTDGQDGQAQDYIEGDFVGGSVGPGIWLSGPGATGNVVAGDPVGYFANGTGLLIDDGATANWIGVNTVYGPASADDADEFADNTGTGIEITGAGTTGNVVAGDSIGSNGTDGVLITDGATGNWIGVNPMSGPENALERNVISGNPGYGVAIVGPGSDQNVVAGNYIGTDSTGQTAVPNGSGGVEISNASDNLIGTSGQDGSDDALERNVISGNTEDGVDVLDGSAGNVVAGNYIGTNAAGTAALANGEQGINLSNLTATNWVGVNPEYGPENADQGNVISGNALVGVWLYEDTNVVIAGNLIGTNASGTAAIPNYPYGVYVEDSSDNLLGTSGQDGSADALERNVISGNTLIGIYILDGSTGNVVAGDYIGTNAAGNAALANGYYGVEMSYDADDNFIGVNPVFGPENADEANVISGNANAGVAIRRTGTTGNVVAGNLIGTDVTGTVAIPNYAGVEIDDGATGNLIGASGASSVTDPLERNIISGNLFAGVWITGTGTDNNVVAGNFIGTTVTGESALGNASVYQMVLGNYAEADVVIDEGASGNLVGTSGHSADDAGQRNIISGSLGDGIDILDANGTVVAGNYIGTDAAGTVAIPNANNCGVELWDDSSGWVGMNPVYGSPDADQGNVVTGNSGDGVAIWQATGIVVAGNKIGTNAAGNAAIANGNAVGVDVLLGASGNTIGGTAAGAGNIISGNTDEGIWIRSSSSNVFEGNFIGTDLAGTTAVPNDGPGVLINDASAGNTIGGSTPGASNLISGNTAAGIEISGSGTTGNVVAGNLIGTDVTGTLAIANYAGVEIDGGASGNLIGASGTSSVTDPLERNIVSGNSFAGVWITGTGTDNNVVAGNFIGTTVSGDAALGNGQQFYYDPYLGGVIGGGVVISGAASDNLIGTSGQSADDAGEANVISGNSAEGVVIYGSGTGGNVVAGDRVGTNAGGTAALANAYNGVLIIETSLTNWVGVNAVYGPENSDQGNVVSGNAHSGVLLLDASNQVVAGNLVGTDVSGTYAIGNDGNGIYLADSSSNLIGTSGHDGADDAIERNVASGNGNDGVAVYAVALGQLTNPVATGNVIAGNLIGTDVTGTFAIGNGVGVGVFSASDNLFGTTGQDGAADAFERNVIAGNTLYNIIIAGPSATGNVIAGDYIGTNAAGNVSLPCRDASVYLENGAASNWIGVNGVYGPDNADQANVIAGSINWEVFITGTGTTGNVVAGNLIGINVDSHGNVIEGLGGAFAGVVINSGASGNWVGVNSAAGPGTESALQRNVISGNYIGVALYQTGTTGNVIAGNLLGTDPTGTIAVPNEGTDAPLSWGVVIQIGASDNLVGTSGQDGTVDDALERNVISGDTAAGVFIGANGYATTGNVVAGNYIGTTENGGAPLPDGTGVFIAYGAANNWVGLNPVYGPANSDQANVISGNTNYGVWISSSGTSANVVDGNLIGTNPAGTAAIANGQAGVEIDTSASGNTIGGTATGAANIISGNTGPGVEINDSSGNVVLGNLIGLSESGSAALGNIGAGVLVDTGSTSNTIGGAISGARNVISGNAQGVMLTGTATADTLIAGNLIGTDAKGAISLPNLGAGIDLAGGTGTTIGGTTALERNLISGNQGDGIDVASGVSSTLIEGNYIGVDQTGTKPLANGQPLTNTGDGISVLAALGITIGGTAQGAGNLISANTEAGVSIEGAATSAVVLGNYIGTDESGENALGNGTFGVYLGDTAGVVVGGTVRAAGNVISANSTAGIGLYDGTTGTLIEGNFIGTDRSGANPLGNGTGVLIDGGSSDNTIGGTVAGAGNMIAYSSDTGTGTGIGVDVDATAGAGNTIRLNSIFDDDGLGISVSSAYYENFPVITSVVSSGGTTTVSGTLNSIASTTFFLDFYTISAVTTSGYGEGRYVLGSSPVTTDGSGSATFSFSYPTLAGGASLSPPRLPIRAAIRRSSPRNMAWTIRRRPC